VPLVVAVRHVQARNIHAVLQSGAGHAAQHIRLVHCLQMMRHVQARNIHAVLQSEAGHAAQHIR
jgi:hypothetical protein